MITSGKDSITRAKPFLFQLIFILLVSQLLVGQPTADTVFLRFPDSVMLPEKFHSNILKLREEWKQLASDVKAGSVEPGDSSMLITLEEGTNYQNLLLLKYWLAWHYKEMIPVLILKITNKKFTGLTNYGDLIIWERVRSGHMKYHGTEEVEADDLFTVAGRSNWLLKQLTGETFGNVSMYSGSRQLSRLQQQWIHWLQSMQQSK